MRTNLLPSSPTASFPFRHPQKCFELDESSFLEVTQSPFHFFPPIGVPHFVQRDAFAQGLHDLILLLSLKIAAVARTLARARRNRLRV